MQFAKKIEFVRRLVHVGAKGKLLHALERLGPLSGAQIFRQLEPSTRRQFFEIIGTDSFLEKILKALPEDVLIDALSAFSDDQLKTLLEWMPSDWVWTYLKQLPAENYEAWLQILSKQKRDALYKIASYPKDSCGEIMDTELMCVVNTATVEDAIQIVRQSDPKLKIFYLYVVDSEGHLMGTVPLRSVIRENPKAYVSDVMVPHAIAVRATDSSRVAAQHVAQNRLLAVHEHGRTIPLADIAELAESRLCIMGYMNYFPNGLGA